MDHLNTIVAALVGDGYDAKLSRDGGSVVISMERNGYMRVMARADGVSPTVEDCTKGFSRPTVKEIQSDVTRVVMAGWKAAA